MSMYLSKTFQKGSKIIIAVVVSIGLFLVLNMPGLAQDVKELAKEANKALRDSQRAMFSGKFEESQKHLEKAAELIEKIKSIDPAFSQLKSLESKYAKQKKDLEKRLPKETPVKTGPATQPKKPTGADKAGKLPGGVTHRLKKIDMALQRGDQVLTKKTAASDDWKVKELANVIQEANSLVDEIMKGYGDQIPPDHPEMKARQDKIAEFQSKLDEFKAGVAAEKEKAAEEQAQREAQSQEWLDKIKPYITGLGRPGYDESKYLIPSGTDNVEEMNRRVAIYNEVGVLFAEYQKVEFPYEKTEELERAEKDLAYALENFEKGYKETVERFVTRAREEIEYVEQWLVNEEAKDDEERKPIYLRKDMISNIKNNILAIAAITSEDDPKVTEFNERLANIEKRAEKLRQLNKERTVMIPDKFKGQEIEELKTKAAEFLHKEYADAEVLRTTIISEDWKEERVLEYTDTTKTAIRYRVTRSVTAQIVGKQGSDVFLYTIHIAKDQRTDGSWGELYGHVMFIDPMLEENVNK